MNSPQHSSLPWSRPKPSEFVEEDDPLIVDANGGEVISVRCAACDSGGVYDLGIDWALIHLTHHD